jgi:hypothetical protein
MARPPFATAGQHGQAHPVKPPLARIISRMRGFDMTNRTRLAVDIGGTFTDLVLSLPNRTLSKKLLSTHDHPDTAVVEGTRLILSFHSGGAGARPQQDGLSATPFPAGVRNVPVEATEAITPLVIWRKERRPDSGGPGRQRGGSGQVMEVGSREDAAFGLFASFGW